MKKHLMIVSVIAAVLSFGLGYLFLQVNLVPNPATVERGAQDHFLQILFSIAGVFFAIVVTVLIYSLVVFRRRPGETGDGAPIRGNPRLEIVWTVIPLVIVIVLSVYGAKVLDEMTRPGPPQTELEVDVLAFRFGWQFSYPDYNIQSFDLYLPIDRKVWLRMQSRDVVHGFWVAEFGPKQDLVPGMTTELRFTPDKIGKYQVQCSQLCGYGHTYMVTQAYVTSSGDFQNWVNAQPKATPKPASAPGLSASPGTGGR